MTPRALRQRLPAAAWSAVQRWAEWQAPGRAEALLALLAAHVGLQRAAPRPPDPIQVLGCEVDALAWACAKLLD